MPKIYLTESDRNKAQALKHQERVKSMIYGKMKTGHISTADLGAVWGITQQAGAYRLRNGVITLTDLYQAQKLLRFTDSELLYLIRGDRVSDQDFDNEKGGPHRPKCSRP